MTTGFKIALTKMCDTKCMVYTVLQTVPETHFCQSTEEQARWFLKWILSNWINQQQASKLKSIPYWTQIVFNHCITLLISKPKIRNWIHNPPSPNPQRLNFELHNFSSSEYIKITYPVIWDNFFFYKITTPHTDSSPHNTSYRFILLQFLLSYKSSLIHGQEFSF